MVLFMGGGQAAPDLQPLFVAQAFAIPLAIIVIVITMIGSDPHSLWQSIPQWLVFVVFLLNALALCGEIALIVAAKMTGNSSQLQEHVPLLCMILCSIAILLLHAKRRLERGDDNAMAGRW